MLGVKDLAQRLSVHPRTVKRWLKRLDMEPTIAGHASHRFDPQTAEEFLRRLRQYWQTHGNGHKPPTSHE